MRRVPEAHGSYEAVAGDGDRYYRMTKNPLA
jgi:hypothetical protein